MGLTRIDNVRSMPEYLLEMYASNVVSSAADAGADRVREATEAVSSQGIPVRYLRSILVASEETCFVLLEAADVGPVEQVACLAQVPGSRISLVGDSDAG